MLKNIFLAILVIAVFIYVVDYSAACIGWVPATYTGSSRIPSDSKLGYSLPKNRVINGTSFNSLGFRGREFSKEKSQNTIRIVCLGGSTTYGVDVGDNETWPAILELFLLGSLPGKQVEVLNAGVPGYISAHSLYNFENELQKFNPDFVIVLDGLNDIITTFKPNVTSKAARKFMGQDVSVNFLDGSFLSRLLVRLRLFSLAAFYDVYLLRTVDESHILSAVQNSLDIMSKNLDKIARKSQENNCKLFIVDVPWIFSKKYGMLDNWRWIKEHFSITFEDFRVFWLAAPFLSKFNSSYASSHTVSLVRLQEAFDTIDKKQNLWVTNDYIHYNKRGNFIIAYLVAQKILEELGLEGRGCRIEQFFPYIF